VAKSLYTDRQTRLLAALVSHRKAAGLTQTRLAETLKKPQSYVAKYERGERRLDVIEFLDIAAALGVEPADLLEAIQDPAQRRPRVKRRKQP
jgi:transcriptional regulator with XRE-family HTH domain